MTPPRQITYDQLLAALLDEKNRLRPHFLYRLSDLPPVEASQLEQDWERIPAWRRQALMQDLDQLGASDLVLSFEAVSRLALHDSQAAVRALAIRIVREYEPVDLIPVFIQMMRDDRDFNVRAEAASALSTFVYLGETEKLSAEIQKEVEDALLEVTTGHDDTLVRRRALESLGYSARPEVTALIEAAYNDGKEDWLASALLAMGRSFDKDWRQKVLLHLDDPRPAVAQQAIHAAGELELKQAVPRLMEILDGDDAELADAALWALSKIGGKGVRDKLEERLDRCEDDEEADFLEQALDNLDFTENAVLFPMLAYDEAEDFDDLDAFDELEDGPEDEAD